MSSEFDDIDVRHIKLTSGEDIIALVVGKQDNYLIVEKPLKMHMMVSESKQSFYFSDWHPFSTESSHLISSIHIISLSKCDDDIKQRYLSICTDPTDDEYYDNEYPDDNTNIIPFHKPTIH